MRWFGCRRLRLFTFGLKPPEVDRTSCATKTKRPRSCPGLVVASMVDGLVVHPAHAAAGHCQAKRIRARRPSPQALRPRVPSRGLGHRVQHDGPRAQTRRPGERGERAARRGLAEDVGAPLARQERSEVPIRSITNGVHVPTWIAGDMDRPLPKAPRPGVGCAARRSRRSGSGSIRSPTRRSGRTHAR